jgi:hypothetical protein
LLYLNHHSNLLTIIGVGLARLRRDAEGFSERRLRQIKSGGA